MDMAGLSFKPVKFWRKKETQMLDYYAGFEVSEDNWNKIVYCHIRMLIGVPTRCGSLSIVRKLPVCSGIRTGAIPPI